MECAVLFLRHLWLRDSPMKSAANLITSVSDSWIERLRDFLSECSAQKYAWRGTAFTALACECKQIRKNSQVNFEFFWKNLCIYEKSNKSHLQFGIERRKKSLSSKKFQKRDRKYLKRFDYLSVFQLKFFRFNSRYSVPT